MHSSLYRRAPAAPALLALALALACSRGASPAPTTAPAASPAASAGGQATAAPAANAAAPTAPPRREAVRFPYSALSMAQLPHWITYDAGLYEREGLDVTMDYVASSTVLAPALLSGEIGLAYAGQEVAIASGVQGGDMVIVGGGIDKPLFWLTTMPSIHSPDDLRGKRIGVADVGGSTDLAAQYFLDKVGLRRGDDVVVSSLGSSNERIGGLQAGAVQGAMLTEPFGAAARKAGFHVLFDLADEDYPLPSSSVATTRTYAQAQPEVVQGFVTAIVDAIHYIKTDREGTMAIMGRFLQQDDRDVLEAIYREASGSAMPEAPYPSVQAFANAIEQVAPRNAAVRELRAEDLVDERYVRALDDSGYIRSLYGR